MPVLLTRMARSTPATTIGNIARRVQRSSGSCASALRVRTAHVEDVPHRDRGGGEDRPRRRRERRRDDTREHQDREQRRGVLVEQGEQHGTVLHRDPEDSRGRQGDEREDRADQRGTRGADVAGAACDLRRLRAEDPLHEVDRHEVADTECDERRPVDRRALSRIGQLAEVEGSHALGDDDAERDGRPR